MTFPSINNNAGTSGIQNKQTPLGDNKTTETSNAAMSKTYTQEEVDKMLREAKQVIPVQHVAPIKSNISLNTYTVDKEVSIMRKENQSLYFLRNAKFIPEGKNNIGSSISGQNAMIANMDELKEYMPSILGVSAVDPKFVTVVGNYFSNLAVTVPESGLNLKIGFIYNSEDDYKVFKSEYDRILGNFEKADKSNPDARNKAFELRTNSIIELEKVKYKHGKPVNVADYILWRYCLVYRDVATDIALVNNSGHIRFYIYDAETERYKAKALHQLKQQAMVTYLELVKDESKLDQVLWATMSNGTLDINSLELEEKGKIIEGMLQTDPGQLISINKDKNIQNRAFIEQLIQAGFLKRLSNTSVITDTEQDIIGNNMDEALAFFNNTEVNRAKITKLQSQLKSLK